MRLRVATLALSLIASGALAGEPRPILFSELPPPLQRLHAACGAGSDRVYFSSEEFREAVLFLVSCPWKRTSSWPPTLSPRYDVDAPASFPRVVYLARDVSGTDAVPVVFPVIDEDGVTTNVTTLPVSAEALHEEDRGRGDTPWIEALWKPDARPQVCKIMGSWRIADGKAELRRWRVAPTCDKNGPKYETRFESDMPRLVVR